MSPTQLDWCNTQAYYMEHGTNPDLVSVRRSDDFYSWAMYALENKVGTGRTPHTKHSSLIQIYSDLLSAWHIANRSRPITMEGATFGEWVRWYETTVMPTWDAA